MTDLTEQWKKGELPEGEKYIQLRDNRIFTAYFNGIEFREVYSCDIKEILAPVPSYQEYLESESHCAVYSEVNKSLKEKNQQLKELLKECWEILDYAKDFACHDPCCKCIAKINQVLGE